MGIGERIKFARQKSGLSQAELAQAVGRSQSAVAEWETGDTEPRRNIVEKIANALNVSALWLEVGGVGEAGPGEAYTGAAPAPASKADAARDQAPIYAAQPSDCDAACFVLGDVVEYRARPSRWENVKGLYGVYIIDDTMAPRMNAGEIAWVHPHRRPAPGQEALLVAGGEAAPRATLRIFAGQTQASWIVRRLNTEEESDLEKKDWDCQLVVGVDWNR